jgi:hypothetical protein
MRDRATAKSACLTGCGPPAKSRADVADEARFGTLVSHNYIPESARAVASAVEKTWFCRCIGCQEPINAASTVTIDG